MRRDCCSQNTSSTHEDRTTDQSTYHNSIQLTGNHTIHIDSRAAQLQWTSAQNKQTIGNLVM